MNLRLFTSLLSLLCVPALQAQHDLAGLLEDLASAAHGADNTVSGYQALYSNTMAGENVALGSGALRTQSFANGGAAWNSQNVAVGYFALYSNQPTATNNGVHNTATGTIAMIQNTTGTDNTANGYGALRSNTTAGQNVAIGSGALQDQSFNNSNITWNSQSVAVGYQALNKNQPTTATNGNQNAGVGYQALFNNTTGSKNTALGNQAGLNLTTGSNDIDIANSGVAGESNVIRIGTSGTQTSAFIAGISGVTSSGGAAVFINSSGQLGTATSSRRFKQNIQPMAVSSESLLALRPVTFQYKPELDSAGIPQWGLIAEEVNEVNPDLVVHDRDGNIQSVRYEQVNAMLLNEFLKEHQRVQSLQSENAAVKQQLDQLQAENQDRDARLSRLEQLLPAK